MKISTVKKILYAVAFTLLAVLLFAVYSLVNTMQRPDIPSAYASLSVELDEASVVSKKMKQLLHDKTKIKAENKISMLTLNIRVGRDWLRTPELADYRLRTWKNRLATFQKVLGTSGCLPLSGDLGYQRKNWSFAPFVRASEALLLRSMVDAQLGKPVAGAEKLLVLQKQLFRYEQKCKIGFVASAALLEIHAKWRKYLVYTLRHPKLPVQLASRLLAALSKWETRRPALQYAMRRAGKERKLHLKYLLMADRGLSKEETSLPLTWPWFDVLETFWLSDQITRCHLFLVKAGVQNMDSLPSCPIGEYLFGLQEQASWFHYNVLGKIFLGVSIAAYHPSILNWQRERCWSARKRAQILRESPGLLKRLAKMKTPAEPVNPFTGKAFDFRQKRTLLCDFSKRLRGKNWVLRAPILPLPFLLPGGKPESPKK